MDLANTLIRSVARAFYETRQVLVIDALFIHSVLHAEDLAHLLGMQQKDLRKLCAKLREDRLIAVHTRSELRDGATRPVNRDYYYIPLHPVIDAIKYRISKLTATIKQQYTPSEDRKEYICLRCGAEWTELDVLSLYNEEGFECQQCGAILERTEDVKGTEGIDRTGHEKNSKLMAQLDHFLKLLKQIDATEIPPNDFETAWDHKVDVVRNPETHPTRPAVAAAQARPGQPVSSAAPGAGAAGARPTPSTVRGSTKTDANAIEVSLTSNEEKSAAEQAAESARKAARERQNALPIWHTQSTVSTTAQPISSSNQPAVEPKVEEEEETKPVLEEDEDSKERAKADIDALDDIAAYYAEIARSKAEEVSEEEEDEDEDEDEEEEDEFEDVGGIGDAPTAGATPTAGIKRELEDTDTKAVVAPSPAKKNQNRRSRHWGNNNNRDRNTRRQS
ncbi:hypothetical protein VTN49DRAFT_5767 [Thermomyces lanuginosus]|uniref:uncharacterized protein n=1 Tax=Thermomyces lanuginosus TaxID=5541 RepID=UPI0037438B59